MLIKVSTRLSTPGNRRGEHVTYYMIHYCVEKQFLFVSYAVYPFNVAPLAM